MRNKKLIKLIVFSVLFIALIVTYVFIDRYKTRKEDDEAAKKADEQSQTEKSVQLVNVDTTDVNKITFKSKDANLTFVYNSDSENWSCEGEKWSLDQEKVSTILTASAAITSTNEIEDKSELSEYGLDKPQLKVTLETNDNSKYTFLVGNSILSGEGNYFMMDGGENVYVVDSALIKAYDYKENQFIQVEEIESLENTNIYYVDVEKKDGDDFSFYYDGDKTDDTVSGKFYITKPYKVPQLADESEIYTYLADYASLSYDECVSYKPTAAEKKKYGLDKPAYTVDFKYFIEDDNDSSDDSSDDSKDTKKSYTHKEVKYYIGNSISEMTTDETTGEEAEKIYSYYVMSSESDSIFLMAADAVEAIVNSDPFECVLSNVNDTDLNAYKNLTVTVGDKKYVLTKNEVVSSEDNSVSYKYTINKKVIDDTIASSVYTQITDLSVSREITSTKSKKSLVATFDYAAGTDTKDMNVQFYTYNDNFYSVKKDGAEYYLIAKQDVDNVLDSIAGLTLTDK